MKRALLNQASLCYEKGGSGRLAAGEKGPDLIIAGRMTAEEGCMETDHRPWGYYTVLADEPGHKVKRICVYPGGRLSLQRHRHRTEHWFLIHGETVATIDDREISLRAGEAVDIPCGASHRLRNTGDGEAAVIEIQTGDYFGEDDIERIADDYGRV